MGGRSVFIDYHQCTTLGDLLNGGLICPNIRPKEGSKDDDESCEL
jgi:hypothetical protein